MKVASFFSGIGGIDLGLEKAGMNVAFQCEILTFGQSILKKHWPNTPLSSDITKVTAEEIPDVDVFAGGFPCQDLSLANQGKRKGLEGARSGLFLNKWILHFFGYLRDCISLIPDTISTINSAGFYFDDEKTTLRMENCKIGFAPNSLPSVSFSLPVD